MKNQKGFTLLEILVVFAIIGLLSAAAASSFSTAQSKARDSQRKSDMAQVRNSLELARSDSSFGLYPAVGAGNLYTSTLKAYLETNNYMKNVPMDPRYGTAAENGYYYHSEDGTDYELITCLENSKDTKKDTVAKSYCTAAGKTGTSLTYTAP